MDRLHHLSDFLNCKSVNYSSFKIPIQTWIPFSGCGQFSSNSHSSIEQESILLNLVEPGWASQLSGIPSKTNKIS